MDSSPSSVANSSSAMTVVSRDMAAAAAASAAAATVVEDDGSLSVTAGLAKEAALLFQSGKYADCLRVLGELLQKKSDDLKVLHNIAITKSFRDGCSDPKRLLIALNNIKKQNEVLAHASDEHIEGSINSGNQNSPANNSPLVYPDEYDNSVALFNMAVIWYHLHEHAKAFAILDMLFQKIEPIDEAIALRVCLLLLDVALASQNASRSLDVINFMERVFNVNTTLVNQVDNGNTTHQAKSPLLPNNPMVLDDSNFDTDTTLEGSLSRTLSDETLDESLQLLTSSLKNGTQNLPKTELKNEVISTVDLRLKWHLYKVHLLLLTRNLKAAKREVKMAMNMVRGNEQALYLKSQLEYTRGNHRKAIKLLMASSMGVSSIYYNNLGCIYFQLGKYHTSNIFFSKALTNSSSLRKDKKLSSISQDKSMFIVYNCGVHYLACGKPVLAAKCFYKASQIFFDKPLLWLRIAECCLMALEKGCVSDLKVNIIGKGKWRHLVFEENEEKEKENDNNNDNLSLSLARKCLLNALHILNTDPKYSEYGDFIRDEVNLNGEVKEQKGGNGNYLINSVIEYDNLCRKESQVIREAILADLAYVELKSGNALKALSTARSLLRINDCSNINVYLANCYAAEALCMLNRPKDAAEYFSIYVMSGKKYEAPYSEEDCEKWGADKMVDTEEPSLGLSASNSLPDESQAFVFLKPDDAHGALYVNLAAIAVMDSDYEQAHDFVKKALEIVPNSIEAIHTSVYVDLMRGKVRDGLAKLKMCNRVKFLPLNGSS